LYSDRLFSWTIKRLGRLRGVGCNIECKYFISYIKLVGYNLIIGHCKIKILVKVLVVGWYKRVGRLKLGALRRLEISVFANEIDVAFDDFG
jgi:hypothetical protein